MEEESIKMHNNIPDTASGENRSRAETLKESSLLNGLAHEPADPAPVGLGSQESALADGAGSDRHSLQKGPGRKKPSQKESNPFPYSSDNKRYHTFSYYLKNHYGTKTAKIPLNASFTCPNRDGTKGIGGCVFCSAMGSGDTILGFQDDLASQYELNLTRARQKWPVCKGMAYFQSYTNTYAPLKQLKEIYTPFYENPDVEAVCIATRADCLDWDMLEWFASWNKDTWIEIGLQSSNEATAAAMNRGHTTQDVTDAVEMIKKAGLHSCVHLINGLPGETREDMLESARYAARIHPDAVKIHMLHVIENSKLAVQYKLHPFDLLSKEEYVSIVCDQLELLPADIVIERLTGDAVKEDLIAPQWTLKKTSVVNDIDTELFRRNSWQGKKFQSSNHE